MKPQEPSNYTAVINRTQSDSNYIQGLIKKGIHYNSPDLVQVIQNM